MKRIIPLSFLAAACAVTASFAAVPSLINYQGRLTDSNGDPVVGSKTFAVSIYDASTAGNLLYTENVGSVVLDNKGIYSFQFGSSGIANTEVSETIAVTNGMALTYQKDLSNAPAIDGTLVVTDGVYSWNEVAGNLGSSATATAAVAGGFVYEVTVTDGGSGYTTPPVVTITGDGSGALATAIVSGGVVTGVTVTDAGSGYTAGASVTIAAPPSPFLVNYSGDSVTVTYDVMPPDLRTITATYGATVNGIADALARGGEQWLELTVEGGVQTPRQRIVTVPFALNAGYAEKATGTLQKQINDLKKEVALLSGGLPNEASFSGWSHAISEETSLLREADVNGINVNFYYVGSTKVDKSFHLSGNWDFQDVYLRGCLVEVISDGYPFSVTYRYTDGTTETVVSQSATGTHFVTNPSPLKKVNNVSCSNGYSNWTDVSILTNVSGKVTLQIPSVTIKNKIGLFVKTSGGGAYYTASLIGENGSQDIELDQYTTINSSIGSPQKVVINLHNTNSSEEASLSIDGYVVRFSE